MFLARRSAVGVAASAARAASVRAIGRRTFVGTVARRADKHDDHGHDHGHEHYDFSPIKAPPPGEGPMIPFEEVKGPQDLFGPGAPVGTIPTDLNQSTGLERLEILGKMQGVDIFDMRPLDASRVGTVDDPIVVRTMGDKQYIGCTGSPADSHLVVWCVTSKERPWERCSECGSVYKMDYVGPPDEARHVVPDWEPKDFSDFVKPDYKGWPEGKAKP